MNEQDRSREKFARLVGIMDRLREPDGCPWDRQQDKNTITNYFLEEVYEAVDAMERKDVPAVKEELGDVLMEIVFLARIYKEKGAFTIADVLDGINAKMIRRHPHVFGREKGKTAEAVRSDWGKQKTVEKHRSSLFDGFVRSGPSLLNAFQIGQRASGIGFDWEKAEDVLAKVREELGELEDAVCKNVRSRIEDEVGDVLFAVANTARLLNINPELALRRSNEKFIRRFHFIERELDHMGKSLNETTLEEMEVLWEKAKSEEKGFGESD